MSHSKQKGFNSCAEWHFWSLTGQPTSISPIHVAFFTIFAEIRFLNLLCFSILGASSDHQTQKGLEIKPCYVIVIEVKHKVKPASMIKRSNMYFTSLKPDFLWAKKL